MEDEEYTILGSNLRYKRHINPDGSKGGWVGTGAHVDKTVFVGEEARVDGEAHVKGQVRLLDRACVSGTATIEGDVVLCGDTRVYGTGCCVRGNAVLSGKSCLNAQRGIIEGYTHLSDIEVHLPWIVISGGEFIGIPTDFGGSHLYFRADESSKITSMYLQTGGEEKELPNASSLLDHITFEGNPPPVRVPQKTRKRGRER